MNESRTTHYRRLESPFDQPLNHYLVNLTIHPYGTRNGAREEGDVEWNMSTVPYNRQLICQ